MPNEGIGCASERKADIRQSHHAEAVSSLWLSFKYSLNALPSKQISIIQVTLTRAFNSRAKKMCLSNTDFFDAPASEPKGDTYLRAVNSEFIQDGVVVEFKVHVPVAKR